MSDYITAPKNKLKHKQAVAKLNNYSVIIYYSLHGKEMKFPTGISIHHTRHVVTSDGYSNWMEWNAKTERLRISKNQANNKELLDALKLRQETIDTFLKRANDIIDEYYQRDILVDPDELKSLLSNQQAEKVVRANTGFFEYYDEFIQKKVAHFENRGAKISIKDYHSTKHLLMDFQAFTKKTIRVNDVALLWLQDLVQFMASKHPKKYGDYVVKTVGGMVDSTIKKRLDVIREFFVYLKELKVVTQDVVDTISSYKKTIKKQPTHKETLDIEEIHALYKFQFENKALETIRDLFVFLCLTGIRYQDLVDFNKDFIRPSKTGTGLVYIAEASKTGINYQIPLSKIVIEILEKYNYALPQVSDQYGNRAIKEALQETGMFDELTQIKDKHTKKYKYRYEAITLHKGRNSFITNLVDIVPLNELMKYTGHKKLSTLQGYIDTKRPVSMKFIEVFDM